MPYQVPFSIFLKIGEAAHAKTFIYGFIAVPSLEQIKTKHYFWLSKIKSFCLSNLRNFYRHRFEITSGNFAPYFQGPVVSGRDSLYIPMKQPHRCGAFSRQLIWRRSIWKDFVLFLEF